MNTMALLSMSLSLCLKLSLNCLTQAILYVNIVKHQYMMHKHESTMCHYKQLVYCNNWFTVPSHPLLWRPTSRTEYNQTLCVCVCVRACACVCYVSSLLLHQAGGITHHPPTLFPSVCLSSSVVSIVIKYVLLT